MGGEREKEGAEKNKDCSCLLLLFLAPCGFVECGNEEKRLGVCRIGLCGSFEGS